MLQRRYLVFVRVITVFREFEICLNMLFLKKLVLLLNVVNIFVFPTSTLSNQEKLRPLPSECGNWETMRLNNNYYVDKTPYLKVLVQNDDCKLCFVTRPRRFGKTTFVDMMANFFEGNENLFKGLSIHQDGNIISHFAKGIVISNSQKWLQFPVIIINFAGVEDFITYEEFKLYYKVNFLQPYAIMYNIAYESVWELTLSYLIEEIHDITQMKVVLLVDEYDALINQQIRDKNHALLEQLLRFTETFLSEIKNSAEYVGMAFVTGVSRLALASLHSSPNNFVDLTYRPELATAFGITIEEFENDMNPYLEEFAKSTGKTIGAAKHAIFSWYNGYNFDIEDLSNKSRVLNPVSTIKCLSEKSLESYWIRTGSMNIVVEAFHKDYHKYQNETFVSGYYISKDKAFESLNPPKVLNLPSFLLMYGYLTITKYNSKTNQIQLKYPNEEIKNAVKDALISYVPWRQCNLEGCTKENQQLANAMRYGHTLRMVEVLRNHYFRDLLPPSHGKVTSDEISRRLQLTFEGAGIQYLQPDQDGGDIDFLTLSLPINYAISFKCGIGGTALNAIMQLVKYIRESPQSFENAMRAEGLNTTNLHLLGLSFNYEKGGKLKDWLAVNYNSLLSNIDLNTVEGDSEDLKKEFKRECIKSHIQRPSTYPSTKSFN